MTSKLTRERLQEIINLACKTCSDGSVIYPKTYTTVDSKEIVELARMALAAMDSEPVAEVVSIYGDPEAFGEREIRPLVGIQQMPYGTKLYRHAQPAPVVPEVMEPNIEAIKCILPTSNPDEYAACIGADMWNACRAAMLQPPRRR
ncbi:hypothetical protein ACXDH5_002465 [Klebsiella pneumoniae]